MATVKAIIKHAGSQLVSNLIEAETVNDGFIWTEIFLGMWRDLTFQRDTEWFMNDEEMLQRDLIVEPGPDEAHFLIRFTIKE